MRRMKIFVSGHSGSGKTTFVRRMCNKYGIKEVSNVMRGLRSQFKWLNEQSFEDRQEFMIQAYIDIHNRHGSFMSDRSVLDLMAWTGYTREDMYLKEYSMVIDEEIEMLSTPVLYKPSLFILLPVPSQDWFEKNAEYFLSDKTRFDTFNDLSMKVFKYIPEKLFLPTTIWSLSYEMYQRIYGMADELDWPIFIPEFNDEDYQTSWQASAEEKIKEIVRKFKE